MKASNHALVKGLEERLAAWRRGLWTSSTCRIAAVVLALALMAALVDLVLPMPERVRWGVLIALGMLVLAWTLVTGIRLWRLSVRDMAARSDELRQDSRRSLLSAYELHAEGHNGFLARLTMAFAQRGFVDLPPEKCEPRKQVRAARRMLLAALGVLLLLAMVFPHAAKILGGRLLNPGADIPPYSSLSFEIRDPVPRVIYGEDVEIAAVVSGGTIDKPVRLLTRLDGRVEEADCFRGNENSFHQRIEKVTQPLEFAFATGNARSRWHRIELLMEPRFALTKFAMAPPAYTGREREEMVLGAEEIEAVEGSEAELLVTSNRPLARGVVEIAPLEGGEKREIDGEIVGVHTVKFRWPMAYPAQVTANIFDVRGTASPEPLQVVQRVVPDAKPNVQLVEPALYSMATPSSRIPVKVSASDDFGLRRVSLVRSMPGFRERAEVVGPERADEDFDFVETFSMKELGVKPGDVLQVYGEGRDFNPALSGLDTSEVARIEIISDEDYRTIMQRQVGMEEFAERYAAALEALENLDSALEQLADAEPGQEAAAKDRASEAAKGMSELYEKLGQDLALYDVEEEINAEFSRMSKVSAEIGEELSRLQPGSPGLQADVSGMRDRLGAERRKLDGQFTEIEDFTKVGEVMELAAEFMQMVERQENVKREFERSRLPEGLDEAVMTAAGAEQQALSEQLEGFADALRKAAGELPRIPENSKLRSDANAFADALESSGADLGMSEALTGASNKDAPRATQGAGDAHERLAALLPGPNDSSGNCFGGMCRSLFPSQDMKNGNSLSQCLGAAMARKAVGRGLTGGGQGGPDGYVVAGYSPLDIPLFGPSRLRFKKPAGLPAISGSASRRDGQADASSASKAGGLTAPSIDSPDPAKARGFIEQVPEKYRNAVKRYFAIEDNIP